MPKKSLIPWKNRTKAVTFRITPEQKAELDKVFKESGFESMQQAFLNWLKTQSASKSLSELETAYLDVKSRADNLWKKLGGKKVRTLATLYKSLGGRVKKLDDYEAVCTKMFKKNQGDIGDLIIFKQWVALNKEMQELEKQIRGMNTSDN